MLCTLTCCPWYMKESINPETVNTPPTMAQTLVKKWVNDLYSSLYWTCHAHRSAVSFAAGAFHQVASSTDSHRIKTDMVCRSHWLAV